MSKAADIRYFASERCSVVEISEFLRVPRWYVRHVMREWGYLAPLPGSYPDTVAKLNHAHRPQLWSDAA